MSAVLNDPTHQDTNSLDLTPLAGHTGAEVRGLRLSGQLSASNFETIRRALYKHKVLFLRGQQHLDDAEHQAFARLWGGSWSSIPPCPRSTARRSWSSIRSTAVVPTPGTPTSPSS